MLGAVVGAGGVLVSVADQVDLPHIRLPHIDLDKLGFRHKPEAVTVVLSRDGGLIVSGGDDAPNRRSSTLTNRGIPSVDLAPFRGSDQQWNRLVQCVQDRYEDYDVDIVDEEPERGAYILAMVGGPPSQLELADTVGGLAPHNEHVIDTAVAFVFQTRQTSMNELCQTTAHEIGHTLGLDHSRLCSDIMSYAQCGAKRFRDADARCGEWDDRDCDDGEQTQNSAEALAHNVGRRERVQPTVIARR